MAIRRGLERWFMETIIWLDNSVDYVPRVDFYAYSALYDFQNATDPLLSGFAKVELFALSF